MGERNGECLLDGYGLLFWDDVDNILELGGGGGGL